MTPAAYDEIADWYERDFLGGRSEPDPIGAGRALRELLGPGCAVLAVRARKADEAS